MQKLNQQLLPADKAKELVQQFINVSKYEDFEAIYVGKQCALIAVEQIIKVLAGVWADVAGRIARSCEDTLAHQQYWAEVKQAIEHI